MKDTWADLKKETSEKWGSIKRTSVSTWGTLKQNASSIFGTIKTEVTDAWEKKGIQGVLEKFISWTNDTFSVSWVDAWDGITGGFSDAWEKIKGYAKEPINGVIDFLNSLLRKVETVINKIRKGISDAIKIDIPPYDLPWPFPDTPKIYWKPISYTPVVLPTLTRLAEGGILDRAAMLTPNVMAGEAGSEAVLPLDRHTEWMDQVADRINARDSASKRADEQMISLMKALLGEMQKFNDKEFTTEITTSGINRAQTRANRRAGTTVSPVGV